MSQHLRSWVPVALVVVLALAAGYSLPRPARRSGDMLDAVAAVQRRSPRFLVSEPAPPLNWMQGGALYLGRTPLSIEDVERMSKDPSRPDPRWSGVVCFKGTENRRLHIPWVAEGGERCLDYGSFAVFGDPEVLEEVRAILADSGFQPSAHP